MLETIRVALPPARLHPLVLCAIWREIALPAPRPHAAVVQANVYACINFVVRGSVCADGHGELPRRFVTGPFTAPLATIACAPLLSLSLVVQPWLLSCLLGLAPRDAVDRILDLANAGGQADSLASLLEQAAIDDSAMDGLWEALARWLPAEAFAIPGRLRLEALAQGGPAASAQALGVSERHYRRLFIDDMGLPPKVWMRTKRVESALLGLGNAASPPLGELAQDAGFADQAHMTREFRTLLDQSPGAVRQIWRRGAAGRWSLEPARGRFLQDDEAATP
jgi:AraC-like DNA-binding protein